LLKVLEIVGPAAAAIVVLVLLLRPILKLLVGQLVETLKKLTETQEAMQEKLGTLPDRTELNVALQQCQGTRKDGQLLEAIRDQTDTVKEQTQSINKMCVALERRT